MKPAAPEVRSSVKPEPGQDQDQDPTPDRPVLAIPGATIGRQVLWLAGPVFVEQSLLYLIGLSDTILAGRYLGAEHLAGVTVASYLLWFLGTLFTIGSIGGTALVARSVGAGRADEAARFCGQAFAVGLSLGVLTLLLVQFFAPWIVAAMNLTGLAALSATRFLRIVGAVTPLLACTTVGNAALRGAGDTRTGMKVIGAAYFSASSDVRRSRSIANRRSRLEVRKTCWRIGESSHNRSLPRVASIRRWIRISLESALLEIRLTSEKSRTRRIGVPSLGKLIAICSETSRTVRSSKSC